MSESCKSTHTLFIRFTQHRPLAPGHLFYILMAVCHGLWVLTYIDCIATRNKGKIWILLIKLVLKMYWLRTNKKHVLLINHFFYSFKTHSPTDIVQQWLILVSNLQLIYLIKPKFLKHQCGCEILAQLSCSLLFFCL